MTTARPYPVGLVFPPSLLAEAPPISIAALTAYLRARGVDTVQLDWNARFNRYCLERVAVEPVIAPRPLDGRAETMLKLFFLNHLNGNYLTDPEFTRWPTRIQCTPRAETLSIWDPPFPFSHCELLELLTTAPERLVAFLDDPARNLYHDFYRSTVGDLARRVAFVGFSVMGYNQVVPSLVLAHLLKRDHPSLHVCWGGPWVTSFYERMVERLEAVPALGRLVDSLVVREGEEPLFQLVSRLAAGAPLDGIANLIRRSRHGGYEVSPDLAWVAAMDALPTPDYGDFDLDDYVTFKDGRGSLVLQGSRSCYYMKCSFCNAITNFTPDSYRERGVKKIAADVEALLARFPAATTIDLADAVFPARRLGELARFFIGLRRPDLSWEVDVRFEKNITREVLALMQRSNGLLRFGLETPNERLLRLVEKGNRMDVVRRILDDSRSLGYKPFLMTIVGLPSETEPEAEELFDFLVQYHDTVTYQIADFIIERKSPIHLDPGRFSIRIPPEQEASFNHYIRFERLAGYPTDRAPAVFHSLLVRTLQLFHGAGRPPTGDQLAAVGRDDGVYRLEARIGPFTFGDYWVKYDHRPFASLVPLGYKLRQQWTDMTGQGTVWELDRRWVDRMSVTV